MIIGYPPSEIKFWAENDLVWIWVSIDVTNRRCGVFDVESRPDL